MSPNGGLGHQTPLGFLGNTQNNNKKSNIFHHFKNPQTPP